VEEMVKKVMMMMKETKGKRKVMMMKPSPV
jgi:hypothetical protein